MSGLILYWSITISQIMILLAMGCALSRIFWGPRAQDRVLAFDAFYIATMLLLLVHGIRSATTIYFEAALVIALLGFISTVALAKFLMRGEVIE